MSGVCLSMVGRCECDWKVAGSNPRVYSYFTVG